MFFIRGVGKKKKFRLIGLVLIAGHLIAEVDWEAPLPCPLPTPASYGEGGRKMRFGQFRSLDELKFKRDESRTPRDWPVCVALCRIMLDNLDSHFSFKGPDMLKHGLQTIYSVVFPIKLLIDNNVTV
jgi:hypothetical protein